MPGMIRWWRTLRTLVVGLALVWSGATGFSGCVSPTGTSEETASGSEAGEERTSQERASQEGNPQERALLEASLEPSSDASVSSESFAESVSPDRRPSNERGGGGPDEQPPVLPASCGPPTSTFFQPPGVFPVGASAGTVVRCEDLGTRSAASIGADARFSVSGGSATFGMRLLRILYVTEVPPGTTQWATALVALPVRADGTCAANADLAMVGHGTTGMAPHCGPSRFPDYGLHHLMLPLVGRGVAVVAPDFLGLGAPFSGGHPYLQIAPTVRSALDAVRAARSLAERKLLPGCVSKNVLLLGHSQGGQAALAAASQFASVLPGFKLLGTVAWGPAFGDERVWLGPFAATFKVTTATSYFLAYLLAAQRWRKGPALSQWLTPAAAQRIEGLLDTVCFAEWDSLLRGQFSTFRDVFSPAFLQGSARCNGGKGDCSGWQFWRDAIAASQIPAAAPGAPTLLVQGSRDRVVSAASVGCVAKRWAASQKVGACVYPQADHLSIIGASWKAIWPWIEQVRQGQTPTAPACPQTQPPACP